MTLAYECPCCGATYVERTAVFRDGDMLEESLRCQECYYRWREKRERQAAS